MESMKKLEMPPVVSGKAIVLGGHYGALAVVKALSREGIRVTVVASDPHDHACHSRFISEQVTAPDPAADADGLLHILMQADRDWTGAFLIPTLDEYVIFVSQHKAQLEQRFVFSVQDWSVINRIINKDQLYPEALRACIPLPRFFLPDGRDHLNQHKNDFAYPCILKPFESRLFSEIYSRKVLVAHNFEDLSQKFIDTQKHKLRVMICEIIPGDDASIFNYRSYIDSRGNVLAEMCTQKLRQYPPGFGQGSVVRTVPLIPQIREYSLKLLRNFDYRGESSAEFRLDARDKEFKLMEINARPVVTEWLFVKAGVNFPYLTYLDLVEDTRHPLPGYQQDLYWIHNHWEAVNFINFLMNRRLRLGEFMKPYLKKKVFAIPFLDDPKHFLVEMAHYSKIVLKKIGDRELW
jgi:predicted ATP-grasp superfamily ATP-dependent carboligase